MNYSALIDFFLFFLFSKEKSFLYSLSEILNFLAKMLHHRYPHLLLNLYYFILVPPLFSSNNYKNEVSIKTSKYFEVKILLFWKSWSKKFRFFNSREEVGAKILHKSLGSNRTLISAEWNTQPKILSRPIWNLAFRVKMPVQLQLYA